MKTLQICETFTSIQGETTNMGRPCFFIRLSKCNLNCVWCDSKYAQSDLEANEIKIDTLVEMAELSGVRFVNVTGGEPLLQPNTIELLNKLIKKKFTVILETNGSLSIEKVPDKVIKIVDYKCPSSGQSDKMLLDNYELLNKNDEVKFVIEDENDYRFALKKMEELKLTDKTQKILFSPVLTKLPPRFLANWMVRDKVSAILQLQIHRFIWPDVERGV